MILYHGSNTEIHIPDLSKCRPYKDFGKGFYLTDIKEQAVRMSERTVRIYGGEPFVSEFNFEMDDASCKGLKIKKFDYPTEEWADFVISNRDINKPQPFHNYDIVIGPVADDNIARLLRLYLDKFIDIEQLKRELSYKDITSQYFFHTAEAIKLLKKI